MDTEGKVLVFNPTGFFVKIIFCIILAVFEIKSMVSGEEYSSALEFLEDAFWSVMYVAMLYDVLTIFGYIWLLLGNFLYSLVALVCLLVLAGSGLAKFDVYLDSLNGMEKSGVNALFFVVTVAVSMIPFIRDIRKAIVYFKITI